MIEQDNGIRVDVPFSGFTAGTGKANLYAASGELANTGSVNGGVDHGTGLSFRIFWDKSEPGRDNSNNLYTGTIDEDGAARGTTVNGHGDTNEWLAHEHFTCNHQVEAKPADQPAADQPAANQPADDPPPTNAISVSFENIAGGLRVKVTNKAPIAASCAYDSADPNAIIPPFHKDFNVGANNATSFDIHALPTGTTYDTSTACTGDWKGKNVEIGRVEVPKQF